MYYEKMVVTGVDFIDRNTRTLRHSIDDICDLLRAKESQDQVLRKLDELSAKTKIHLSEKVDCQDRNDCVIDVYAQDVLNRLAELRTIIKEFGPTMSPQVAVMEVRRWAEENLEKGILRCRGCKKS